MDNQADFSQQYPSDLALKIRDMEEKLHLLKDRLLLLGQTHITERDETFFELQELKSSIIKIKEENLRITELLKRITEQLNSTARKEDFNILQRQLDLIRSK